MEACLNPVIEENPPAMGTRVAPSYANIFMTRLEEEILHFAENKPTIWARSIDDIFFIWPHGEEKLHDFIKYINQHHKKSIKFTKE